MAIVGDRFTIADKALNALKKDLKEVLPDKSSFKGLPDLSVKKRDKSIDSKVSAFQEGVASAAKKNLGMAVTEVSIRSLRDSSPVLQKAGINLSPEEFKSIQKEFMVKYHNERYFALTPAERADKIARNTAGELKTDMTRVAKTSDPVAQGERVIRKMKGNATGLSVYNQTDRFFISEINRANAAMTNYLAEQIGAEFLRWLTVGDGKVSIMDRSREAGSDLGPAEKAGLTREGISWRGVYHQESIGGMHRHPYCRCWLEIVVSKNAVLGRLGDGLVEDMFSSSEGLDLVNTPAKRMLNDYVASRVEMGDLPDISPERIERRKAAFHEAANQKSMEPLQFEDRMLFNNYRKGQKQAVLDFAAALGKKMDPDFLDLVGPDNALKVLMRKEKPISGYALTEFNRVQKIKAGESLAEYNRLTDTARKYKGEYEAASRPAAKMALKKEYINNLNRARVEMGNSLGYLNSSQKAIGEIANPAKELIFRFPSSEKLQEFVNKYPAAKFNVYKSQKAVVLPMGQADKFLGDVDKEAKDLRRIKSAKEGRLNKSTVDGAVRYRPQGAVKTFERKGKIEEFGLTYNQERIMRFMKETKSTIINAAPGVGKTPIASSVIAELRTEGKVKKVLYVTKDNLVVQTQGQLNTFIKGKPATGAKVVMENGVPNPQRFSAEERKAMYSGKTPGDVHVVSFSNLRNDIADIKKAGYDMVIVDEFHLMGKEAMGALGSVNPQYRFLMSGTPIQNAYQELWQPLKWVDKTLFKRREEFVGLFSDVAKSTTFFQESMYRKVNNKLATRMITQESELKPYRKIDVDVKLKENARGMKELDEKYQRAKPKGKTRIRKERQDLIDSAPVEKMRPLVKILGDEEGYKKIIFVNNKNEADSLIASLGRKGYKKDQIARIDTSVAIDARAKVVDDFKNTWNKDIIVMDAQSSAGVDLPEANVVVHFAKSNNAAAWTQRTARAWRVGSVGQTRVYDFNTDTIEDVIRNDNIRSSGKVLTAFSKAETVDTTGMLTIFKQEIGNE